MGASIRIYSWNTHTGGSMQIYGRVFQYQTSIGVRSIDESGSAKDDAIEWIWKITPFRTSSHTYYLAFNRAITCGSCRVEGVKVYSISDRDLKGPLSLFKSDRIATAELGVEFRDFGRAAFSMSGHAIVYDSVRHIFKVPKLDEMNDTLSNQYTTYAWTGAYFLRQ